MARTPARSASLLLAVLLVGACSAASSDGDLSRVALSQTRAAAGPPATIASGTPVPAPATTVTTAPAPSTVPTPSTAPLAVAPLPPAPTTTAAPAAPRMVTEQAWTPFATVGGVTLVHPSARVERVGFHQSNHEGARQLEILTTAVEPAVMEGRGRLSGSATAADVVADPAVEIRSPVTGTVKRAGTYVLYCRYSDDFAVIEPDAHPGWEVKILHIDGVRVGEGARVVAGETVIADGPTPLPFGSQVDDLTLAATAWPHAHIEVIDLAIPDIPSPGGGCP